METRDSKSVDVCDFIFILWLISASSNMMLAVLRLDKIQSVVLAINFVIALVAVFYTFTANPPNSIFVLWIVMLFISFIAVIMSCENLNFDNMKKWIMCMSTINLYFFCCTIKPKKIMVNASLFASMLCGLFLVYAYFTGYGYSNVNLERMFTFGMSNPNLTAIWLLSIFLLVFVSLGYFKKRILKVLCLVILAFLGYFIWLTEARACMGAMLVFLFFYFINYRKYSRAVTFFVVVFPIVFALIYMYMANHGMLRDITFSVSEGKSITSRVYIWRRMFKVFTEHPILGNYSESMGNGHNIWVDTLATYGIIFWTLLVSFLCTILNTIGKYIKTKKQMVGILAFYTIILSGTFEAALFAGSVGFYFFSGIFLLLAKYDEENYEQGSNSVHIQGE